MAWVDTEYAAELSVLSAWLAALLPWTITYGTSSRLGATLIFLRFPAVQLRYVFGLSVVEAVRFDLVTGTPGFAAGRVESLVAAAGGVPVVVAALYGIALYADEERVGAVVDPLRVVGVLLGLGAAVLTVATSLLWTETPGLHLPVGLVVLYALVGILLSADRAETRPEKGTDTDGDDPDVEGGHDGTADPTAGDGA
ncbi:hypothetical protein BRD17_05155 [Halobacteriales archaeon SW_7_68_16]|nr:MAG: hypothetical protein BRD17_05155 [Halobacteriales archaeon SW_7_68_16]